MQCEASRIFKALWLADLQAEFPSAVIQSSNLTDSIPLLSVSKVAELFRRHKSLALESPSGVEVSMEEAKTKEKPRSVLCFSSPTFLPHTDLLPRMLQVAPILGIDRFLVRGGGLYSKGQHILPKKGTRLVIVTPIFERLCLLDIYAEYTRKFLIPALAWQDLEVYWFCAGGPEEKVALQDRADIFFEMENNLAAKKNTLFDAAREVEADYTICIDSDDFFSPETVSLLIQQAKANTFWSALEAFVFFSAEHKKFHHFEGYPENHDLYQQGLGSGRVFTRKFLDTIQREPFGSEGNKSMDSKLRESIKALCLEPPEYLVCQNHELPIGVKTKQNIWSIQQYDTSEVPANNRLISWIPKAIFEKIRTLPHDAN